MSPTDEEFLDDLLKKIASNAHILPNEYSRLEAFFTPTIPPAIRAKGFVVLSAVCDHHRRWQRASIAEDDPGTHNVVHLFLSSVEGRLAEAEERPLVETLSFVAALFAVDWRAASAIFARDGFQDSMMDSFDLFPSSTELPGIIASVLSSACGYQSCRECLSPRCMAWLETVLHHTKDDKLKASASLALLKSAQTLSGTPAAADTTTNYAQKREETFEVLRTIIVNSTGHVRQLSDAIEGLAYLSTMPRYKARIADDDRLLQKLVSFQSDLKRDVAPFTDFGTAPFGLAVLTGNLCSYRPQLTEEQAQIERLKRMARPQDDGSVKNTESEETLDDDEHVRSRARRLVAIGASDLLVVIARSTESSATRITVGKALLGLIEDKDDRGKVLQSGGAKCLQAIIRASRQHSDAQAGHPTNADADLLSIQALAKLAITASPMQVFGPNENNTIEAIPPFAALLLSASSTLLQKFEAVMALTNIASVGSDFPERIARIEGLVNKLEFHLLDENQFVRRAATELICNLVSGSESVFNRFSGDDTTDPSTGLDAAKSRLRILIALSDVEDEATRLAASGALAILTGSPVACKLVVMLEFEHHRVFGILKSLIDPSQEGTGEPEGLQQNPGLVHRGIVCIRNIFMNVSEDDMRKKISSEAIQHDMVSPLTKILKSAGKENGMEAMLRPTAETIKWLMDSGVEILPQ